MTRAIVRGSLLATSAAFVLLATPARAQVEVTARGSTLGLGVDVGFRLAPQLGLRVGGNMLSFTRNEEVEGIPYRLRPDLESFTGTVDLYPFGSVLHLSGGLVMNRNAARADATIGSSITIGSQTYSNTEVQALGARLDWDKEVVPYAGIGFATGGRVGIAFEVGVMFSGTPEVALSGTTSLTGAQKTAFDQAVEDEEAEVRAWIDDNERFTKYYPVAALGLRFRF